MMDESTDSTVLVEQAGQIALGRTAVAIHRTLSDRHSSYVVMRCRHGDEEVDLTARPGQEVDVPGAGRVLVVEVRASTTERRGAVLLHPA